MFNFCDTYICNSNTHQSTSNNNVKVKRWGPNKSVELCKNIDISEVDSILNRLCVDCDGQVDKKNVNSIFNCISDLLVEAAKQTFGIYSPRIMSKSVSSKEWFNSDCFSARKQYRRTKSLYKNISQIFLN